MPDLDPAKAARITDHLALRTARPAHADLAFIFGTRYPDPAPLAADAYRQGIVPLITLTGGPNRRTNQPEALIHRALLRAAGVPAAALIVETHSTNTLENVTFALPLIAARLAPESVSTMLVIAKWFHARRALMTLKKHWPRPVHYYLLTYSPEGITPENWHTDPVHAAPVLRNWENIPRYLQRGHLAEIASVEGAWGQAYG